MTHATAIVGQEAGIMTGIKTESFSAGGYLMTALLSKNLDLAYLGPGPYLSAKHKNIDLQMLSVSAIGGNTLVTKKINKKFKIKHIAIPQLANTQDLLAKILVKNFCSEYFVFDKNIDYLPVNPAELETAFFVRAVEAALVAEPWGTILESKSYRVFDDLGDINNYPTTILVIRKEFYENHKDLVENFLRQEIQTQDFIKSNPDKALALIQKHLEKRLHKSFDPNILKRSFNRIKFENHYDKSKFENLIAIAHEVKYFRREVKI